MRRLGWVRSVRNQRPRVLVAAAVLLLAPTAFAQGPDEVEADPLDPSIYGGSPSATCGWPTTVLVTGGGGLCTGTLVHPQVVITAAHCTGNGDNKQFGFGPTGNSRSSNGTCYPHPNYNGNATNDIAYCTLTQPVDDVPIAPPLFGCEVSQYITPGQQVEIVGYGQTNQGGAGTKYEVTTTITGSQNGEVFIGGNGLDSCSGDSGGPVYVRLDDGSWRVFGVTSYGGQCGSGGVYSNMATNLAWVEQQSGIDISPCHDAQGNWTPGFDCGGFPTDPGSGNGTSWAQGCGGGPVSGFSSTCGTPFSPEGDRDPPSVTITAPTDGATFMTDGSGVVSIHITVDADDGAGFGVEHVSLRIDGEDIANTNDNMAPYEWDLVFTMGSWTIEAVGVDLSQNMAVSNAVTVGVDQAPEPPSDGGGDGDGDGGQDTGGDTAGDTYGGLDTGGLPPGYGLDDSESGCACATDRVRGPGLFGLLGLLGLLGLRRRRV